MNYSSAYIPGSSTPVGLSTCTSVSSVLDAASRELDVRVTLPGKLNWEVLYTPTVADCPTWILGAFICGTEENPQPADFREAKNLAAAGNIGRAGG